MEIGQGDDHQRHGRRLQASAVAGRIMTAPELRPYQRDVVEAFHASVQAGNRRIILVAPTGSGKTIIGADVIRSMARKAKPIMVLAHRREIIQQTSQKLVGAGISHGIIQAGFKPRKLELVQVASIQTLWVRAMHNGSMDLPPADLIVVDRLVDASRRNGLISDDGWKSVRSTISSGMGAGYRHPRSRGTSS